MYKLSNVNNEFGLKGNDKNKFADLNSHKIDSVNRNKVESYC